jgi:hypothetical protein
VFCICAWAVFIYAVPSFAVVVTIELGSPFDTNPDLYIVDVQQLEVINHSDIQLLIENIEDPLRWKDWELTVYVPEASDPLTHLDILDYRWGETSIIEIPDVPMEPNPDAIHIQGYDAYYADTSEALWYEYGTQPVGAGWGRVDVGNPAWISFHFYVDVPDGTPVFISAYDVCIPEPTTIALLSLGALALIRKRR